MNFPTDKRDDGVTETVRQNVRVRTYSKGPFKGRSYEINENGTDGARVFKPGEKITGKHKMIRRLSGGDD